MSRRNAAPILNDQPTKHGKGRSMIKSAIVVMTLLGCDCDAKVCDYLADAGPRWESLASCEADMKSQVLTRSHLDYPLVTAECRAIPDVDETIQAKIDPVDPTPAADDQSPLLERTVAIFRQTGAGYDLVRTGVQSAADGLANSVTAMLSAPAKMVFR